MLRTEELTAKASPDQVVKEADTGSGGGTLAAVGILGALAASACCILPLVLFGAGISGAWISNLTALAPYQPIFVAFTLAVLGFRFWRVYGPQRACAEGEVCAKPIPTRFTKIALWLATALVGAALAFPYLADLFLPD